MSNTRKSGVAHGPANFDQITDFIWIGNNMCCAIHNRELLQLGFDADIDLEENRAEEPPHTSIYLWLPTKDHTPPTMQQLKTGVTTLTSLVKQHIKVYVHCKNGHGRAPTLVAAHLITHGKTVDEAIAFIKERRPVIHLGSSQIEALKQFAQAK